jgi:isoleucyl-tRNA synthetase
MTSDYRSTVFLPKTDFPMRGGLPDNEPKLLKRWDELDLYKRLRAESKGRELFILHDGPPYANGHLHIGHALNKILKDVINRSQQMLGKDANYVPGWDCHGLPIEWKIEEEYRAKGKDKDEVPILEFRRECREFAEKWVGIQSDEFQRLGVVGDWQDPYLTMALESEARIAAELMKFAANGRLFRGSKPVMWSVVEKTALAEAEVEYHDHTSPTVWVKFPVGAVRGKKKKSDNPQELQGSHVVIWTTTPWTIPANRAIAYSKKIEYGLYEVMAAPADNWARVGDKLILADVLAEQAMAAARVENYTRLRSVDPDNIQYCEHPFNGIPGGNGYWDYDVPVLPVDYVTDDAGTGFVHTAPGHGADDYDTFVYYRDEFADVGLTEVPHTVGEEGEYYDHVPLLAGKRIFDQKGKEADANKAVIELLVSTGALIARGRLSHSYPHSWRSKAPLIFRNTPQWFISMGDDKGADGLRAIALKAIDETRFVPASGQARLRGMIEARPDWVISRQRAWGVPIAVFARKSDGEVLIDDEVNARIFKVFAEEGADAWFKEGAAARFLGNDYDAAEWEKVDDILDVWFESGSTHAFVLEERADLKWPASLYLEGTDQHRGWFHSSLLESCGTRGRAPYDAVLTHGFILDEQAQKMSKSAGNALSPQDVVKQYGADILRLWVVGTDYTQDPVFGPETLKQMADIYRRLRNTLRYLLGALAGFEESERVAPEAMPELERWVLHRVWDFDRRLREACDGFEFHPFFAALHTFCANDLSAFYFDIRKDALYCDPADDPTRRAARTVLDILFDHLTAWLAPFLAFTAEEAWLSRNADAPGKAASVHLRTFPDGPAGWRDDALAEKWAKVRTLRRVVTGALELERAEKRIGSSLQAAPRVFAPEVLAAAVAGLDFAEICITSDISVAAEAPPAGAFTLPDVADVGVVPELAEGEKCARCWRVLPEVGRDASAPELCRRCASAVSGLEPVAADA